MEKIPLYLDRKFVTFIGFRFFFKGVHFLFKTLLLVVVVFCFGCTVWLVGSLFPYQGLSLCPQQWECGVLTTGQPGSSPKVPIFKNS